MFGRLEGVCVSLPQPDYSRHPDYAFGDISPAERIRVLTRIAPYLAEAATHFAGGLAPDYEALASADPATRAFARDGVTAFDCGVSPALAEAARSLIGERRACKLARPAAERTFEDCVTALTPDQQPGIAADLRTMLAGAPDRLLQALYGGAWEIELFLLHGNDESDAWVWSYGNSRFYETPTLFYHVDTTVNRLKAMLYLTDEVTAENGAFSYVTGSHLWNRDIDEMIVRKAVRNSGLYLRDPATRRSFAALPAWMQLKNDVGSELAADSPEAARMMERSKSFPSSQGRLVIFDPSGVHCGGVVRRGAREAIQIVFRPA
jgi:hypothetical protein